MFESMNPTNLAISHQEQWVVLPMTILRSDLVGSKQFSATMTLLEIQKLLDRHEHLATAVIGGLKGVRFFERDGDAVVLGLDSGHATDAVSVAIEMQERVRKGEGGGFSLHHGIATGEVVIKDEEHSGPIELLAHSLSIAGASGAILADAETNSQVKWNAVNLARGKSEIYTPVHSRSKGRVRLRYFDFDKEIFEVVWADAPFGLM